MTSLESITGPHPPEWPVIALGELCEVRNGPTGLAKNWAVREGVPVISPADIVGGRILLDQTGRIPLSEAQGYPRHRLRAGDVVMIRTGSRLEHAVLRQEQAADAPVPDSSCIWVRVSDGRLIPDYLDRYLAHPAVQEWLERRDHAGVIRHRRGGVLQSLPVLLPPVPEQQTMAEVFRAMEEKIRVHEEIVTITRQLQEEFGQSFLQRR
jgi:type I restriction enzyme S subunit